jgi:hypothetical protein
LGGECITNDNEKPVDPRARRIWKLEQEGKSKGEIAATLEVNESTVYRIKRRPDYIDILRENRDEYLLGLKRMRESDHENTRNEAVKEMGRLERSGANIVAKYQLKTMEEEQFTPEEKTAKWHRDMKQKEFLWNKVVLIQPWQKKRLDLYFSRKPYEHIKKDWVPPPILSTV